MFNRISRNLAIANIAILLLSVSLAQAQPPMPQATVEHKSLASEVGVWDAEAKFWLSPDTDPMVSKAVETNTMLGNLWLISEYKGDMGGMPFVGHGQFGYDPVSKKYIGTWIDSLNPYLSVMEGTMDPSTKKLTMISKGRDPETGEQGITKMVSTYQDEDHKTFEMFAPSPDAVGLDGEKSWWKRMEISYTRRQ